MVMEYAKNCLTKLKRILMLISDAKIENHGIYDTFTDLQNYIYSSHIVVLLPYLHLFFSTWNYSFPNWKAFTQTQ